jgi:hypothetical protein
MTDRTVTSIRQNTQLTPQQHLTALIAQLETKVAGLRIVVRTQAEELSMAQENLRAHEMMLESTTTWWEEGLLT